MSDFLFARPSFWEGIGRIIDMGDTLTEFNRSLSAAQADRIALEQDWLVVGNDLRRALRQFTKAADKDGLVGRT